LLSLIVVAHRRPTSTSGESSSSHAANLRARAVFFFFGAPMCAFVYARVSARLCARLQRIALAPQNDSRAPRWIFFFRCFLLRRQVRRVGAERIVCAARARLHASSTHVFAKTLALALLCDRDRCADQRDKRDGFFFHFDDASWERALGASVDAAARRKRALRTSAQRGEHDSMTRDACDRERSLDARCADVCFFFFL
jgi:hypothetical protein